MVDKLLTSIIVWLLRWNLSLARWLHRVDCEVCQHGSGPCLQWQIEAQGYEREIAKEIAGEG